MPYAIQCEVPHDYLRPPADQATIGHRLALGADDNGVLLERAQGDGRGGRRYVPGSWEQAVAILTANNFRLTTFDRPGRIIGTIGGDDEGMHLAQHAEAGARRVDDSPTRGR